MKRYLILAFSCLFLPGCATMVVPEPSKITLEDALSSVGRGIVLMKKAEVETSGETEYKTGLIPAEVTVTFNIAASASNEGKLYVELTPVPSTVVGKTGVNLGASSSGNRSNQVMIKFRNLAFSQKSITDGKAVTLDGPTDPEILSKVMDVLKEKGVIILSQ